MSIANAHHELRQYLYYMRKAKEHEAAHKWLPATRCLAEACDHYNMSLLLLDRALQARGVAPSGYRYLRQHNIGIRNALVIAGDELSDIVVPSHDGMRLDIPARYSFFAGINKYPHPSRRYGDLPTWSDKR